jgi:hypothetical protein
MIFHDMNQPRYMPQTLNMTKDDSEEGQVESPCRPTSAQVKSNIKFQAPLQCSKDDGPPRTQCVCAFIELRNTEQGMLRERVRNGRYIHSWQAWNSHRNPTFLLPPPFSRGTRTDPPAESEMIVTIVVVVFWGKLRWLFSWRSCSNAQLHTYVL